MSCRKSIKKKKEKKSINKEKKENMKIHMFMKKICMTKTIIMKITNKLMKIAFKLIMELKTT